MVHQSLGSGRVVFPCICLLSDIISFRPTLGCVMYCPDSRAIKCCLLRGITPSSYPVNVAARACRVFPGSRGLGTAPDNRCPELVSSHSDSHRGIPAPNDRTPIATTRPADPRTRGADVPDTPHSPHACPFFSITSASLKRSMTA